MRSQRLSLSCEKGKLLLELFIYFYDADGVSGVGLAPILEGEEHHYSVGTMELSNHG